MSNVQFTLLGLVGKRLRESRVANMMLKGKEQGIPEPFQHLILMQNYTSQCWQVLYINNKSFAPGSYIDPMISLFDIPLASIFTV